MKWDREKALKNTIVMLSGDEETLRRRALSELTELASEGDDFDLESFFGDTSDPEQWFASAGTAPFLSPRRTVVVRNLLRNDAFAKVKNIALPGTALVLLVVDEESGDESKLRRLQTVRKNWEKAVTDAKGVVLNFTVEPKALRETIRAEAEQQGKKLRDKGAELIAEMCGESLSRALEELEKLSLYTGSRETITESDVKAVVLPSRDWNVFKLVDAIIEGDAATSLRQLRVLVGNNPKAEGPAFQSILPNLSRQLRLAWQARICIEAKCQPSTAPASVSALFPSRPNLASERDWAQRRSMQTGQRVNFTKLATCFKAISDADARLKGLESGFNPLDTLERMVLEMIQAVKR